MKIVDPEWSAFDFWTADGWLWMHRWNPVPCEAAANYYRDERAMPEWIDLGGEA